MTAGAAASEMNSNAGGTKIKMWAATADGAYAFTAGAASLSFLTLVMSDCELFASLMRSNCAKSSLTEIAGNSSERTKATLTSPGRWPRHLFPSRKTQRAKAPTANRIHSELRHASSVMCAQGHRSSDASSAVCAQGTKQIANGRAATRSALMIRRSLVALLTLHLRARRGNHRRTGRPASPYSTPVAECSSVRRITPECEARHPLPVTSQIGNHQRLTTPAT